MQRKSHWSVVVCFAKLTAWLRITRNMCNCGISSLLAIVNNFTYLKETDCWCYSFFLSFVAQHCTRSHAVQHPTARLNVVVYFFFTIFVSFFAFTQLIVRINFHKEINLHRNVINGFACEFDMDFGNCLKLKIFDGRKWYMVKQYRCSCFNVQSEKQTH